MHVTNFEDYFTDIQKGRCIKLFEIIANALRALKIFKKIWHELKIALIS